MQHSYKTHGVCSRKIRIELEDGVIKDVEFVRGCNGNAKGIAALVKGMPAEEVVRKLAGIRCDSKRTSCPDQLAKALREYRTAERDIL